MIDEHSHKIEVIVPESELSIAIGRQGQNVRLASKLLGWNIDILTDSQESKRNLDLFKKNTELFVNELKIDEMLAQILVAEGFASIEELANIDLATLSAIEGLDENVASELITRANEAYNTKINKIIDSLEELGVEQDLIDAMSNINPEDLLTLAEYGIKTLEDLAEMNVKEFKRVIVNKAYTDEEIQALIDSAKDIK